MQIIVNCTSIEHAAAVLRFAENIEIAGQHPSHPVSVAQQVATGTNGGTVTPAPTVPVTVATPVLGAPVEERDVNGVPYNPLHHADTRGRNKDGSWKQRRGADKVAVAAYEAQFTGVVAGQPVAATTSPFDGHVEVAGPSPFGAAPVIAPSMGEFQTLAGSLMGAGKLTAALAGELMRKHRVTTPGELATNDAARAAIYAEMSTL